MRLPFPKGLFRLAWYTRVGNSFYRTFTHLTVTCYGTKSLLFTSNTKCFYGACFLRYSSTCLDLVPRGSRASITQMMTSEESITLYSSSQIRGDCPAVILLSRCAAFSINSSSILMFLSPSTVQFTSLSSTSTHISSKLEQLSLTLFLRFWGPYVSSYFSTSRILILFSLTGSTNKLIGSLLALIRIDLGSFER